MQQSIDKGLAVLEQSLELAKRNFPDATLARAYSNLGHSEIRGGRYAQAVEHLTLAKSIGARHCDELEIARFEMYHATALVHMRKLAEAAPILARAEQAFRKAQALPGLEISAQLRASIHDEHDQWDSADGAYQEAERLARKLGTQMPLARALLNRAATLIYRGLLDEALRCLEEAEPIARESGYLRGVSLILFQRAWILVMRGRHEEARTIAEEGLANARKNANTVDIGSSSAILGRVALAQGRLQESLKYFQESREAAKRIDGKDYLSNCEYHEALSLVALNRPEEARKLVSDTLTRISAAMRDMPEHERKHMTFDVFGLTASLAKSVAALGDLVRARGLVNQLEESLRHGMFKYRFRSDSVQVGMEVIENVKALLQRHGV
jgi:MalT-like TPR region/Tetratricopeptide repeat